MGKPFSVSEIAYCLSRYYIWIYFVTIKKYILYVVLHPLCCYHSYCHVVLCCRTFNLKSISTWCICCIQNRILFVLYYIWMYFANVKKVWIQVVCTRAAMLLLSCDLPASVAWPHGTVKCPSNANFRISPEVVSNPGTFHLPFFKYYIMYLYRLAYCFSHTK